MEVNIGFNGRLVRVASGLVVTVMSIIVFDGPIRWIALILGLLGMYQGFSGHCFIMGLLGRNTAPENQNGK